MKTYRGRAVSKALYRKYRSKSLDEVIGQNHITGVLAQALKSGNISHAYLFTGPRGVGKTSVARILAYEINKIDYNEDVLNLDIIEIDAASNNGVDDVRDLREKVQIAPVSAIKKVYIIDEVHMLSKPAFNALLKTLEEPPEHVIFILATTNVEKVPATIISRTQRFSFRPIKTGDVIQHLKNIATKEKIVIEDGALELIAKHGDGSFRDSISLLDQVANLSKDKISTEMVANLLGLAPQDVIFDIINSVEEKNFAKLVKTLELALNSGIGAVLLAKQITAEICSQISEKPQLLPLLDRLIEIEKSPRPSVKLLSVLGSASAPTETNEKSKPRAKTVALLVDKPEVTASVAELKKELKATRNVSKTIKQAFSWDNLLEYTKANSIALYTMLSKCGHDQDGDELKIYTNNNFYKKKIDTTKYNLLLTDYLQSIGVGEMNIHTIPTSAPPQDERLATITAMMGGGEQIKL